MKGDLTQPLLMAAPPPDRSGRAGPSAPGDDAATRRLPRSAPDLSPGLSPRPARRTPRGGPGEAGSPVRVDGVGAGVPAAPGVLDHLGVPAADPDELVEAVLPVLRAAHAAGRPVTAIAGRRTVGLVRDALDGDLVSLSPAEVLRPGPRRLITALRDEARVARRVVVLVEYPAAADPADVAEWEAACSLVLADRPLTLLCSCARGAPADVVAGLVTRHPALLSPTGRRENPDHRPPADRSPSSSGLWGRRLLRFAVTETADDLDRLRVRVGRTAGGAGFDDDRADAAIRAAEEAVTAAGEVGAEVEVELRVHGHRLLVDVTGRGGGTSPRAAPPVTVPPGGAAAVHDDGATRRVRVLVPATVPGTLDAPVSAG